MTTTVDLPKWPQMVVWGEPVTVDQAKNIILRTDDFLTSLCSYSGGNNHDWNRAARKILGIDRFIRKIWPDSAARQVYDVERTIRQGIGYVGTEYVRNDWASSCFIGGPHGWCHPDGTIRYGDNIGKWPSVDDVLDEWSALARAFPYLDLHATLMSKEACEEEGKVPVVTFRVKDGKARQVPTIVPADTQPFSRRNVFGPLSAEQGLPDEWIVEYGEILAEVIKSVLS